MRWIGNNGDETHSAEKMKRAINKKDDDYDVFIDFN